MQDQVIFMINTYTIKVSATRTRSKYLPKLAQKIFACFDLFGKAQRS